MNRPRPCVDPERRWRLALWLAARKWRLKPITPDQRHYLATVAEERRIMHWSLLTDMVLNHDASRCNPTRGWRRLWKTNRRTSRQKD